MAKFKVGDRIRCTDRNAAALTYGKEYTVSGLHRNRTTNEVTGVTFDDESGWHYDWRFELAEPLKLERGAIVRLKDGVDEWEVRYTDPTATDCQRGAGCFATFKTVDLVVVKEKPEPPKPDYYVNCKGAEPKDGDVFIGEGESSPATVHRGTYRFINGGVSHDLRLPYKQHAIGNSYAPRTLLVRDGKPYTG